MREENVWDWDGNKKDIHHTMQDVTSKGVNSSNSIVTNDGIEQEILLSDIGNVLEWSSMYTLGMGMIIFPIPNLGWLGGFSLPAFNPGILLPAY